MSTGLSKFGACGTKSRQKLVEMPHFCLPTGPKSVGAEMKVEQKQRKMKKCSTAESKIVPRGDESRTKTEKNEKMFYRGVQNRAARR